MASSFLQIDELGPVTPAGALHFDAKRKKIVFRGEVVSLSDGALRLVWSLLREPGGVSKTELLKKCVINGVDNNLHKAAWEFRSAVAKEVLVLESGLYRLNKTFLERQPPALVTFDELAQRLSANRSLPIGEFAGLLFESEPREMFPFGSEALIFAPDPFSLVRAKPAAFAASLRHRNFYFIATSPRAMDRIPLMLTSVCEAGYYKSPMDALHRLQHGVGIVILNLPFALCTDPVYILNSHSANHSMRFLLASGNDEAIFLDCGDSAAEVADSLRSHFRPLHVHCMIRVAGGSPPGADAMENLRAGVEQAFDRLGSEELTKKALAALFEEPERKQPTVESKLGGSAMAAKA